MKIGAEKASCFHPFYELSIDRGWDSSLQDSGGGPFEQLRKALLSSS